MLGSIVCRQEHFDADWYRAWMTRLKLEDHMPRLHRKPWEFAAVAQTLEERGFLRPGARGLGFAVGTEPLASIFASYGVHVVATDLDSRSRVAKIWSRSNEHSDSKESLYKPDLVARDVFDANVEFGFADMNGTWPWPEGSFDFVWSCCAFEHTGSLEHGMRFVLRSSRLLKPGGIGVHTTEFNCSSNERTLTRGSDVIYRRRDLEELDGRLRDEGRALAHPDYWPGDGEFDRVFAKPPFGPTVPHVKLLMGKYISTSVLITVL
jgi:SAM-dependent methyltransferase